MYKLYKYNLFIKRKHKILEILNFLLSTKPIYYFYMIVFITLIFGGYLILTF